MNYYSEIKNKLIDNEIYSKVKDYSKERHRVITYYEIGKLLSEAGKHYGYDVIGEYSNRLMMEVGKKYNKSTLHRIKKFYLVFSNQKVAPLEPQLSWSHYKLLIPLKNIDAINYYMDQVIKRNLTKRQLQDIIKIREYERLPEKTKDKLINKDKLSVEDIIPNPIIIKCENKEIISEKVLQNIILENISSFLKDLGTGFAFIDNEYKIKLCERYNYIDLLLYNTDFNCYVVVELKIGELKKEHIGQIEVYMNYIDNNLKKITQDKTIGIIMCKSYNELIMKYISDDRILSREYKLI